MQQQFNAFSKILTFKGLKAEINTFTQKLHYLTHIESYKKEITGIKGKERSTTFFVMFGRKPMREPETFKVGVNTLLDRYIEKIITVQDLPIFKAEVNKIFNAHVNVDDKSRTEEEEAQYKTEMNKIHKEREAERTESNKVRDAQKGKMIKEYPYLIRTSNNESSRITATRNIRAELNREFPGLKFSITSETYSGGDQIDVRWVDGAMDKEVNEIVKKYQEGHFDGMTDCYNYSDNPFTDIFGGVKFVFTHRTIQDERYIEVAETLGYKIKLGERGSIYNIENITGILGDSDFIDREIRLQTQDTSFYKKSENSNLSGQNAETSTSIGDVTVRKNESKGGVEILFPSKPSPEIIEKLKTNGFRWSFKNRVWYKKLTENSLQFAEAIANQAQS